MLTTYRGWKIERETGATWIRTERDHAGRLRDRRSKVDGWLLHYPDGGNGKFVRTLQKARDYIDAYEGT